MRVTRDCHPICVRLGLKQRRDLNESLTTLNNSTRIGLRVEICTIPHQAILPYNIIFQQPSLQRAIWRYLPTREGVFHCEKTRSSGHAAETPHNKISYATRGCVH